MMQILLGAVVIGGGIVALMPLFVVLSKSLMRDRMDDRRKEWRLLAAKLAIVEFQAITFTNGVRKMLGQNTLTTIPILASMGDDWRWAEIMNTAKVSTAKAVNDIKSRWDITQ